MNRTTFFYTLIAMLALTVWSYWSTLLAAAERWSEDPQYSHGYLIPLFSLYLLYHRRAMIPAGQFKPAWYGLILVLLGQVMRAIEAIFYYNGLDILSLLPTLLGGVLVIGGLPAARWTWPSIGFLVFMVPLPFRLQTLLSGQLQQLATQMSSGILVMLGYPAVTEGTTIIVDDITVRVVDACSGLGMIVTFAALSAGFALLTKSTLGVRFALLVGALPVAVICNVIRITATAMVMYAGHVEFGKKVFHDLAGWLMMPLGCALILLELMILDRLVVTNDDEGRRRKEQVAFGDGLLGLATSTPRRR